MCKHSKGVFVLGGFVYLKNRINLIFVNMWFFEYYFLSIKVVHENRASDTQNG